MECPPKRELIAARQRLSMGARCLYPATVSYLDLPAVEAAANIQAETFALGERGPQKIQSVAVIIGKHLLSVTPQQGDPIKVNGLSFKVVEVQGHNEGDVDWFLRGSRTPGSDDR